MKVAYAPAFIRQFKKLPTNLQNEALEKIALFKDDPTNPLLKVHKLRGKLSGRISFSVNYSYRILFMWEMTDKSAILLAIGDHAIYE